MAKRLGRPPGLVPNGPEIRRLRVDAGLTAAQVARQLGWHPGSYVAAEGERRRISDVSASRLARMLGVKVTDIIRRPGGDIGSEPEPKVPAA